MIVFQFHLQFVSRRAASIRVASAVWWFFTLTMVSSYTANLAAFLVAESTISLVKDVEDFKNCGLDNEPECKVKFGMKQEGSTYDFFKVNRVIIMLYLMIFFLPKFYFGFVRSGL